MSEMRSESVGPEKESDLQSLVQDYFQAFADRDRDRCMGFFADNARIDFALGVYRGRQEIERWHDDRFGAELRLLRVESIKTAGQVVTVDAVATSKIARAWRVNSVSGRVTFVIQEGKIVESKFRLRSNIPLEGW
jgi:hypothetical protein